MGQPVQIIIVYEYSMMIDVSIKSPYRPLSSQDEHESISAYLDQFYLRFENLFHDT